MLRKPTMIDVARAAGVGTMTVSRVLNRSQHVSPETEQRVLAAMAALQYRPNETARALRSSRSRTVGLLVPNLYDNFFATCAHAINMVARQHGYTVLLTVTNDDPAEEHTEAQRMLQRHVEGLVVIPSESGSSVLGSSEFSDIPVVTLDQPLWNGKNTLDSVVTENHEGMRRLTDHMVRVHGLRRILFLGHRPDLYTMVHRYAGYEDAMRAASLATRCDFGCISQEATNAIVRAALQSPEPPQAILAANNLITRRVLSACLHTGVKIPEQLALAGFDDLETGDLLHPALTVVRQHVAALGEKAGHMLFARLRQKEAQREQNPEQPREPQQVVLPAEMVVRHSCGCAYTPSV